MTTTENNVTTWDFSKMSTAQMFFFNALLDHDAETVDNSGLLFEKGVAFVNEKIKFAGDLQK